MNAAAKAARGAGLTPEQRLAGGGRSLLADHAEGCRDAFIVARDFVLEIAVAPADARGQIAGRVALLEDVGETVRGAQLPEATRA
jgi:hypothetical protein